MLCWVVHLSLGTVGDLLLGYSPLGVCLAVVMFNSWLMIGLFKEFLALLFQCAVLRNQVHLELEELEALGLEELEALGLEELEARCFCWLEELEALVVQVWLEDLEAVGSWVRTAAPSGDGEPGKPSLPEVFPPRWYSQCQNGGNGCGQGRCG